MILYIPMKRELRQISNNIYKVWAKSFNGRYSDTDWHNVFDFVHAIEHDVKGVIEVGVSSGKYVNNFSSDWYRDGAPYRHYDLQVETEYGVLSGYIWCCASGTLEEPFAYYDMVVCIYDTPTMVKEALDLKTKIQESPLYKAFVAEVSKLSSFKQILQTAKTYAKRGLAIGMILSTLYLHFGMSQKQKDIIATDIVNVETAVGQLANDVFDYNEPKWELLTDECITTVYHAVPAQCNDDCQTTASGYKLNMKNPEGHRVIAMERTMMKKYNLKYGMLVKIEGTGDRDGVYQIQDTMNKRFKGMQKIDILINQGSPLGKWDGIKIYKLTNGDVCAKDLKDDMLPAMNQSQMEKRQANIYDQN